MEITVLLTTTLSTGLQLVVAGAVLLIAYLLCSALAALRK